MTELKTNMDNIKYTYSPARYDGPLNISKTMMVAKVEIKKDKDEN